MLRDIVGFIVGREFNPEYEPPELNPRPPGTRYYPSNGNLDGKESMVRVKSLLEETNFGNTMQQFIEMIQILQNNPQILHHPDLKKECPLLFEPLNLNDETVRQEEEKD